MTAPRVDTQSVGWQAFVLAWWMRFKDEEVSLDQIFTVAVQTDGFRLGRGGERARKTRLAMLLNSCRAEVIAGYRVTPNRAVGGQQRWRLLQVEPEHTIIGPASVNVS
jgi:hypothetical protein